MSERPEEEGEKASSVVENSDGEIYGAAGCRDGECWDDGRDARGDEKVGCAGGVAVKIDREGCLCEER